MASTSPPPPSSSSPSIQLKCYITPSNVFASFQFGPLTLVSDVCRVIRSLPGAAQGQFSQFGLFKSHEEYKKCEWLDMEKSLDYYHIKSGDMLHYRNKLRPLRVRTLENFVKIVQVDDNQCLAEVTRTVCSKFGLPNHQEYSLTWESDSSDASAPSKAEKKRKKYHLGETPDKSLREQGITETTVVTLRKKYFFSDQNVDLNDSVQLNLLYVQSRDAILDSTHPCTKKEAILLAALQYHIQHGGIHDKAKQAPCSLNLSELLPAEYASAQNMESSILQQCAAMDTLKPLEAMFTYIQQCQSLPTYGVTFFLVKWKLSSKIFFKSGLLGIKKDAIMVLDVNTKDITCSWPYMSIQRWGFNERYLSLVISNKATEVYIFRTTEGEAISRLLSGYIDITLKATPVYETIPDTYVGQKTSTSVLESEGYTEITNPKLNISRTEAGKGTITSDVNGKNETILDKDGPSKEEDSYVVMQQQQSASKELKAHLLELQATTPTILSNPGAAMAARAHTTASALHLEVDTSDLLDVLSDLRDVPSDLNEVSPSSSLHLPRKCSLSSINIPSQHHYSLPHQFRSCTALYTELMKTNFTTLVECDKSLQHHTSQLPSPPQLLDSSPSPSQPCSFSPPLPQLSSSPPPPQLSSSPLPSHIPSFSPPQLSSSPPFPPQMPSSSLPQQLDSSPPLLQIPSSSPPELLDSSPPPPQIPSSSLPQQLDSSPPLLQIPSFSPPELLDSSPPPPQIPSSSLPQQLDSSPPLLQIPSFSPPELLASSPPPPQIPSSSSLQLLDSSLPPPQIPSSPLPSQIPSSSPSMPSTFIAIPNIAPPLPPKPPSYVSVPPPLPPKCPKSPLHPSSPPPLPPKPYTAFISSEEPPRYLPFPVSSILYHPPMEEMKGEKDGSVQSDQLCKKSEEVTMTAQ